MDKENLFFLHVGIIDRKKQRRGWKKYIKKGMPDLLMLKVCVIKPRNHLYFLTFVDG
jgi:hypothetical protein